jgi:hypothetical protein
VYKQTITWAGGDYCPFQDFRLGLLRNDYAALRGQGGLGPLDEDAVEQGDEALERSGLKPYALQI